MDQNKLRTIKWITRIAALLFFFGGLPFYFGYGNPLPFINQEYTWYDNLRLTTFPLMFIGLALGWKYEKTGGYLITIFLLTGFITSIIIGEGFSPHMLLPFSVGILYLIVGYKKQS